MIIRDSGPEDNQGLLDLTRRAPMSGGLQLRIDRDPDFFEILRKRGEYRTFVVEDKGSIVGSWSVVTHSVYINGSKEIIHYLRDLKLDPQYQGSLAIFRLFKYVTDSQRERSADLHFTIALRGNQKVISMLGGRAGLSNFEYVGTFNLNYCIPTPFRKRLGLLHLVPDPDLNELCNFYDKFYKNYQFGPVITTGQLKGYHNILLKSGDKPVAAITLEDPTAYRKTIVVRYSFTFRVILSFLRLLSITRLITRPPGEGDTLKTLYVKYLAHDQSRAALKKLIKYSISLAYKQKYHFLCLGLHEKDPMLPYSRKLPGLKVDVLGYISSLSGRRLNFDDLLDGLLFEDHPLT